MNFELLSIWDCRVVSVDPISGTFQYTLPSGDPETPNTLRLDLVTPRQRSLVQPGTDFLYCIGVLTSSSNTEPTSFLLFPSDARVPSLPSEPSMPEPTP